MADAIDAIIDQWRRELPDVDIWPMSILGRIVRLSRVLEREYKKFFAEHGLEPFEFDVLTTLRRTGEPYELTASAMLKAALVTSGVITNRIDRMEVKGLVERVRGLDDRRSVRIRLTPHGREVLDGIFSLHIANAERMLQPMDREECEQLASALRILLASFGDNTVQIRALVENRPLESLARASLATTCQARPVCQATCSGEACPRQAFRPSSTGFSPYLNGIVLWRHLPGVSSGAWKHHSRNLAETSFTHSGIHSGRKWLWHNRGRAHGMRNEFERLSRGRRPAPLDKPA